MKIQKKIVAIAMFAVVAMVVPTGAAGASGAAAPNRLIVERAWSHTKSNTSSQPTTSRASYRFAPAAWELAEARASRIIAVTPMGVATCGRITCTFTWDRDDWTPRLNQWYGGDYTGTKAIAVGVVVGLACLPFTGPYAVVCGGVGAISFSYVQETLAKAVRERSCMAVKFINWGGVWLPYKLDVVPVSSFDCWRNS